MATMKQNHPHRAAGLTAFSVIAASLFLFFVLFHLGDIGNVLRNVCSALRPVFIGAVIAFLLLPVHKAVLAFTLKAVPEGRQSRRILSALNVLAVSVSLVIGLLVIYLLLAIAVPQVYKSVVGIVKAVPDYADRIQAWINTFFEDNPDIRAIAISAYESAAGSLEQWLSSDIMPNLESAQKTLDWIRTDVLPNLTGMMTGVSNALADIFALARDLLVSVIVSAYLLARKDLFAAQCKKLVYCIFPTKAADIVVEEARNAFRILSSFVSGKLLDSLVIGILCFIGCCLLQFPYPALVAVIVGATNVIPFFGPLIGAIPCGILIFLTSPVKTVYFAVFILALQQFDGNILGPRILGNSTGLASFWVLFAILLFGGMFGFAGMVLGVPVFAMLYGMASRLTARGLLKRGLPADTAWYIGRTEPMANPAPETKSPCDAAANGGKEDEP